MQIQVNNSGRELYGECLTFPAGERHVKLTKEYLDKVKKADAILAYIKSSDDLMDLLLTNDILENNEIKPKNLIIPYIPYGRQDRATTQDQPFSLRVFARIINSMNYNRVITLEPHSDVTGALINNLKIQNFDQYLHQYLCELRRNNYDNILLFSPDSGGTKRVERACKALIPAKEIGQALKIRNPSTGKLEITFVSSNVKDKDVVVVDDICDGGATFVQLAPKLMEAGAKSLHLFVAHGIFSKGFDQLRLWYKTIGTTDSYFEGVGKIDFNGFCLYNVHYGL